MKFTALCALASVSTVEGIHLSNNDFDDNDYSLKSILKGKDGNKKKTFQSGYSIGYSKAYRTGYRDGMQSMAKIVDPTKIKE